MMKFKKYLIGLMLCLTMCLTSCSTYGQVYTKVYYDYVITGVVNEPGFVNDGYYSYHIVGTIPMNVYWELWPCGNEIRLYNRSMVFQRWFTPSNHWIFYNTHRHHTFKPQPPHKPHGNVRPPQRPPQKPGGVRPPQNNHRPSTHPPRNNNNRGRNGRR